ncbi:thiamine ABC transporter ATP-binding protein [Sulfitobacter donghicola]|uniref:Thiamine ABC transporter ATP-binding protein n=1 Tax=Sulfitobacter donghicola DSW-25 = KCTC 12864 = JCM 14565 TaxID=1300350 RepID=A0A073IMN3_9RHOB|nr:ATP-binding cassette domain-containing protein [Sulfitobacter donghicola]KEJ90756.1 thiamine ABC transporter ATP-binding protein [Sulfitobacter donghicola DSW-25 = KCTC 12864 = JCM 14565]KIN68014.1 ABC transporter related protein [Sulfitobacter donghicola DSW-25 = KCTC 12864 = JCM 14565]
MLKLEKALIAQGDFAMRADFTLEAGRKYAVIGPSGAGKSTLLSAMCGFVPLAEGRMVWRGQDITDTAPDARDMTMLFQDNNLFPHLTVMQNVGLGLRPDLRLTVAQKQQVAQALARVELAAYEQSKPANLSGGQQSRVALARVLVQARPVVLLDEPFAALGPALRNEMLDLVQDLVAQTGAALVMVTHAPDDVHRIADEVIFVESGRAHAPRPAADLMENPPPELRAYLG